MFREQCILKYDPKSITGNSAIMFKPWWLIAFLEEDNELIEYYNWFINKRTGLKIMRPAWGPHISIIRGEEPINIEIWKKYEGQKINFNYSGFFKTNGNHWWLSVSCDEMNDIREELGLPRKHEIGLHLTLGSPIPIQKEMSEYYTRILHKEF